MAMRSTQLDGFANARKNVSRTAWESRCASSRCLCDLSSRQRGTHRDLKRATRATGRRGVNEALFGAIILGQVEERFTLLVAPPKFAIHHSAAATI